MAMRSRQLGQTTVSIATILLAGCVPATCTVVPEVRGRVLTQAGQPVADARVKISSEAPSSDQPAVEATTDAHGQFHRNEQTRWTIVPLIPLDAIAREFTATASYAGSESEHKRFGGGGIVNPHHFGLTNKSPTFDLGDLILQERPVGR